MYLNDGTVIAGGHDNSPIMLTWDANENNWSATQRPPTHILRKSTGKIDSGSKKKAGIGRGTAMNHFRQMDSRGQSEGSQVELDSVHQNTIT